MSWWKFIIVTVVFFILAHYVAVFPHEFTHSIMAWFLGVKVHPLNIYFGGTSYGNILLLLNIDENNNYYLMYLLNRYHAMSVIGAAGPGMNVLLYIISTWVIFCWKGLRKHPLSFYFVFWFNLINLGNMFDYIPFRVFTTHGDIGHVLFGLHHNISPWWVYIIGTYIVITLYYLFFTKTLPIAYKTVCQNHKWQCLVMLICVCLTSICFFALAGVHGYSPRCTLLSITAVLSIPFIIVANLSRWKKLTH